MRSYKASSSFASVVLPNSFPFKIITIIVHYRMSFDLPSNFDPDSSATEDFLPDAQFLFDAAVNRKEISDADYYWRPYRFQSLLDEYVQLCPRAIGKLRIFLE